MVQGLANGALIVNGATISIVPNSFKLNLGKGEVNVRAASAGGDSIETVHTSDAETKISKPTFELYNTIDNINLISEWAAKIGTNVLQNIETLQDGDSISISVRNASLCNDPELELSADGNMTVEFKGSPAIVG